MSKAIKKLKKSHRIGKINISFWQGIGSVIDLFGFGIRQKVEIFDKKFSSFDTDYDALSEDMRKVGNDHWNAFYVVRNDSFPELDIEKNNRVGITK